MMKTTQEGTKPYVREQLQAIEPGKNNEVKDFPTMPPTGSSISAYVKTGKYYGYNSESIEDVGWGCAWRCIQMVLCSELQKRHEEQRMPTFNQLFLDCGSRTVLLGLYAAFHNLKPTEIPASLSTTPFAPHDLESGWAEPFIGQLALFQYGFKHQLLAVNSVPVGAHSPAEVFADHIITFQDLVKLLMTHFAVPDTATPVMIDNGSFAYCIIGIGSALDGTYHLWIADPHIKRHVDVGVGMYWVTLEGNGAQKATSVIEAQRSQMYAMGCDRYIDFCQDSWMILI